MADKSRKRRRRLPPPNPIPLGYTGSPRILGRRPAEWLEAAGLTLGVATLATGVLAAMFHALY